MNRRSRIIVAIVTFIAVAYLVAPAFFKLAKLKHQRKELSQEIRELNARNQKLENELRLLREDPVYLEYIARKKFKKAKEGEVIYRIVDTGEVKE